MRVTIRVDDVAALRAGNPTGEQLLELTDAQIAQLTPEERQALADAIEDGHALGMGYRVVSSETGHASEYEDVRVPDASLASLRAILSARAQTIIRERTLQEQIRAAASIWIQSEATEGQRTKWTQGTLTATDVRDLARVQLFRPLSSFPRMRRLKSSEICSHTPMRRSCKCSQDPVWAESSRTTIKVNTLRSFRESKSLDRPRIDQYRQQLEQIKKAAPKGASIQIIEIRGVCSGCRCTKRRYGVHVTIDWERVPLSLRYALESREDDAEEGEGARDRDWDD